MISDCGGLAVNLVCNARNLEIMAGILKFLIIQTEHAEYVTSLAKFEISKNWY
jgi:hypothetical protein